MKVSEIAALLDAELEGGADLEITGAAPLDRAGESDLSIVASPRYLEYVEPSRAGLLLVSAELRDRVTVTRPRIVVENVHASLVRLLPELYPEPRPEPGVHETAVVDPSAQLGTGVSVGPLVVVGPGARIGNGAVLAAHVVVSEQCVVGNEVRLYPHVVLYRRTRIGDRSIVHAGSRLGVDGFGYTAVGGAARKVPQIGDCVVGSDVEIGANVTIDRGSIGSTEIGDHVKIDNLVHIAHNVRVGAGSTIVAQVGVAGSTRIGTGVTMGGQAGVAGHAEIGDGATLAARGGAFGDIPAGETWSGYPARPHAEALRAQANLFRLDRVKERVRELERMVEELKGEA